MYDFDEDDYPAELQAKTLVMSVECDVCLINLDVKVPSGEECQVRGDITRVGFLADGAIALDVLEGGDETTLTIPLAWVDYWSAECPKDWGPLFPTEGTLKGLRFVLDEEIEKLGAMNKVAA